MNALKFLQNPSDLPWIIISQLILALAVAHFGSIANMDTQSQNADAQEMEVSQKETKQNTGNIYIIRMGRTPDECVLLSADGTLIANMSIAELDMAALKGSPVLDLSLSEDKQHFLSAISEKLRVNGGKLSIAFLGNGGE